MRPRGPPTAAPGSCGSPGAALDQRLRDGHLPAPAQHGHPHRRRARYSMLSAPDRWPAASARASPSRSTARCRASNGAKAPDLRICPDPDRDPAHVAVGDDGSAEPGDDLVVAGSPDQPLDVLAGRRGTGRASGPLGSSARTRRGSTSARSSPVARIPAISLFTAASRARDAPLTASWTCRNAVRRAGSSSRPARRSAGTAQERQDRDASCPAARGRRT